MKILPLLHIRFLPALVLLLFTSALMYVESAEAQPVRISVSEDSLRAGQLFDVYIVFEGSRDFDSIILPDSTVFSDPFEYINSSAGLNAQLDDSLRTRLQFFGSESDTLGGLFAIGIRDADTLIFDLPDVAIYFKSSLTDEELRPLKPIFSFGVSLLPWVIGFLLIAGLLGAGYYIKKRWFPPGPDPEPQPAFEPPPPFINPLDYLNDEITAMRGMLRNGDPEDDIFYVKLGDAIRAYLERVYGFPALEQTTREVGRELKSRSIDADLQQDTIRILQDCDMVKFAKSERNKGTMQQDVIRLQKLSQQYRTHDSRLLMQLRLQHERKYLQPESPGNKGEV